MRVGRSEKNMGGNDCASLIVIVWTRSALSVKRMLVLIGTERYVAHSRLALSFGSGSWSESGVAV